MCGIGGIIELSGKQVRQEDLEVIHSFLKERGPDAEGFFIDKNIGFCHRRLSIIDLNPASNQPFSTMDGNIVIVYNGEIYNFPDLRKDLEKMGYIFKTHSDTEVICLGYHAWGMKNLLSKLEGMFAFTIYDKHKQKVFFARDRFGKKPFYFYHSKERIIFSSDIRSIWALEKQHLNLDFESLDYYLVEISSPQPKSIWKEIEQIKQSHYKELDLESGKITEEKYWHLPDLSPIQMSLEEILENTESLLKKAILKRTISDVPVGCFLSGGVDSGLIVSMLATDSSEKIKTFTVGLTYQQFNELPEARIVAEKYQTDHHEIILESDVIKILPELVEYYGEPFADSSMIPTYYVCKALRGHVTVALSGDGGDELFGGYDDYGIANRTDEYVRKYPNALLRKLFTQMDKVSYRFSDRKENMGSLMTYLEKLGNLKLYREIGIHPNSIDSLYSDDMKNKTHHFSENYLQKIWEENNDPELATQIMRASLDTRLVNDYLVKVDRASMKNSLEVRSPFLDHTLAEWAFQIPNNMKFNGNINKYILKSLAQKYFDPGIMNREKRGFGIPVHEWLRKDLKKYTEEILFNGSLERRNWFNMNYIRKIWKEHLDEKPGIDHTHTIWALLCLEIWLEHFLPN